MFITENVYQPSRCENVLEDIRQCCMKHGAHSIVCDGIDTSKPYEHNTIDYVSIISYKFIMNYGCFSNKLIILFLYLISEESN